MTPPTERPLKVLVLAASLRSGSLNQKLVDLAARYGAAHGVEVDRAVLAEFDVPAFDGDP